MSDVIHALLERGGVSFGPEDVAKLVTGPAATQVAKLIIELAKDGQRDPERLAERATRIVRGSS